MICRNNSNILKHFENFLKKYLLFLRTYSIILKYHTDGQLVKRLRRRPLTAETGVRFPYELLTINNLIAQPIEDAESQIMVLQHFLFYRKLFSCKVKKLREDAHSHCGV